MRKDYHKCKSKNLNMNLSYFQRHYHYEVANEEKVER